MQKSAVFVINTSVMTNNSEDRVTNEVRTVVDGGVNVAGMLKPDKGSPHPASRYLCNAKATLMGNKLTYEHGISIKLERIRRRCKGDDGPVPGLDKRLTAKVVVSTSTSITIRLHDGSTRREERDRVARVSGHGVGGSWGGGGEQWRSRARMS